MSNKWTFDATGRTIDLRPDGLARTETPMRLPERYADRGLIGRGNMGEVRRVYDHLLRREVAMKIIAWQLSDDLRTQESFIAEANLVARLQHPGIVPVHDRGMMASGRAWFTMPLVRGHTFSTLIAELHAARTPGHWQATARGWTFRRLLAVFGAACNAVAYAHSQGVIHRDLKPSNIMVGAFGQVQVMDWGISGLYRPPDIGDDDDRPRISAGVSGTPAYMAPEQAAGSPDQQGPAADVYSLGAILYELLSGTTPYTGSASSILTKLRTGSPPPSIHTNLVGEPPPLAEALLRLCDAALAHPPHVRPPNAEAVAQAVNAWLDGEQRRDQARQMVADAAPDRDRAVALHADAAALREAAAVLLTPLPPNAPIARKAPAWEMEDRAAELERDAELTVARWEQTLRAALEHDPTLPEAHTALADHYQQHMAAAEARRDPVGAARFEVLLRTHDRGQHRAWLSNEGRLSLQTVPPDARIEILRYTARRRRLVAEPLQTLQAPLQEHALAAGSYLLRLSAPGHETLSYPVLIERGGHWDGCPPGTTTPHAIVLPRAGTAPRNTSTVPAGPCWLGGDPEALDPLPRRRWWIDGFFIQHSPVTYGEYLDFLNDLLARGHHAEALQRVPAEPATVRAAHHPHAIIGEHGVFILGADGEGKAIDPRWPVVFVRHEDACAYADWWATVTGRVWRLPHDHEWEKAARGVDGRIFPWGDHFDPSWACTVHSRDAQTGPAAVDAFEADLSPYGVRSMAGNTRDWCCNAYSRSGPGSGGHLDPRPAAPDETWRMLRGGMWYGAAPQSRLATRFVARPTDRLQILGFRLLSPW